MANFVLTLNLDNAAFDGDGDIDRHEAMALEIARSLRAAAVKIRHQGATFDDISGTCMDLNGNCVGSWEVES